jgi:hypothetical protein
MRVSMFLLVVDTPALLFINSVFAVVYAVLNATIWLE